jgi:hypothetical protein
MTTMAVGNDGGPRASLVIEQQIDDSTGSCGVAV